VDLPATFADLAGIALPPSLDGRSLRPLLGGGPTPSDWRAAYLLEHTQHDGAAGGTGATTGTSGTGEPADPFESDGTGSHPHPRVPSFQGLRTGDALYVEYADGERELYDLRLDPDQLKNIAAVADPARIAALSAWLASYARCAGQTCRAADVIGPP
jgi:arylsulfatase A-like enzyme